MAPVVADASALLAPGRLNRLELLRDLFQQVHIPPTVSREVSSVREALDVLRRGGFRLRQDVYEQILADADENGPADEDAGKH